MRDVIIALLPAIVVSVVFYGWSELLVLAVRYLPDDLCFSFT